MIKINFLFFLFIFFLPTKKAYCDYPSLKYDWNISFIDKEHKIDEINKSWKDFEDLSNGKQTLVYKKSFILEKNFPLPKFLVLPPIWVPFEVMINEDYIFKNNSSSDVKTRIFASNIIPINSFKFLEGENILRIIAYGEKNLGGFKNQNIYFTNNKNQIDKERKIDLFTNDIHILFVSLTILIIILCFFLSINLKDRREELLFLGFASLSMVPYNLLSTDIFSFLFYSSDIPFRLNLATLMTAFPLYTGYLISLTKQKIENKFVKFLSSTKNIFIIVLSGPAILIATIFSPFYIFQFIIYPIFFIETTFISIQIFYSRNHLLFFIPSIISCFTALLSLSSDILNFNFYYMGYGTSILSATALYIVLSDSIISDIKQKSLTRIIQCFIPKSAYLEIEKSVYKGFSTKQIRENMMYFSTVGNIFVDICDWGVMSEKLPRSIVMESRNEVFDFIGNIMEKYNLEMVKTIGDNIHFACGLDRAHPLTETQIAELVLSSIENLLDQIDTLNALLQARMLPAMKVKISATIGTCSISLDGYDKNMRFDIQGHWVNVAKRYEEHMNENFYSKYGRNVVIVSNTLIALCNDIKTRMRFSEPVVITDKHNQQYHGFIGRQYQENISKEDFLRGIYGQFRHEPKITS